MIRGMNGRVTRRIPGPVVLVVRGIQVAIEGDGAIVAHDHQKRRHFDGDADGYAWRDPVQEVARGIVVPVLDQVHQQARHDVGSILAGINHARVVPVADQAIIQVHVVDQASGRRTVWPALYHSVDLLQQAGHLALAVFGIQGGAVDKHQRSGGFQDAHGG